MAEKILPKRIKQLSKRIKYLRKSQGYKSYETFAYEKGLPRAQYGRYESGSDLKFTNLVKVIDALGVSIKEFFKEGFE